MADLPTIEGFRLLEELGSGSLCSVYKAVEEPLGRTVALKVLRSTISPRSPFAAQLEREARVLAELSHPNIGALHAFRRTDAHMHLVLEFVDGWSLATLLKKKQGLPPDPVAAIGAAVARGLAHAHAHGFVHRDVKPANILVSRPGDVKIFDFGIAQRVTEQTPGASSPRLEDVTGFGTPSYMSPEQILGEEVDARSDVFSLGVVLYHLLCGARPFERGDEVEGRAHAQRIRRDPPVPLHRRAPDVPVALERAVMRAIEKLPADRFQTAEAFAEQLEALAEARTGRRGAPLVVEALVHAGLMPLPEATGEVAPRVRARSSTRRAVAGLAMVGLLSMAGGVVLQATASREGKAAGSRPLELVPAKPGYLRVLATPWAEVWVDGQRVDVTPFARAIPLQPGIHYVTLSHPDAPAQKRSLSIATGETATIDVVMDVAEPEPRARDAGAATRAERDGADPSAEREKR